MKESNQKAKSSLPMKLEKEYSCNASFCGLDRQRLKKIVLLNEQGSSFFENLVQTVQFTLMSKLEHGGYLQLIKHVSRI